MMAVCTAATQLLLAQPYADSTDPTGWWISEKFDGVRAYWDGKDFFSRQGNVFHVPSFFKYGLPEKALDGEIWCGRGSFQKCVSIVKKQGHKVNNDDYKLLNYLIFDAPSHEGPYEDRMQWVKETIPINDPKCFAKIVTTERCQGRAHLQQRLTEVTQAGGEGLMLRRPGSHYEHRRSSTLLKVKTFRDQEALVVGHKSGKGTLIGMVGALECQLANGKRFDVGNGLTNEQRRQPPAIGTVISVKFQEFTNGGIPRFPVFLRVRSDLNWNDVLEVSGKKRKGSGMCNEGKRTKKNMASM